VISLDTTREIMVKTSVDNITVYGYRKECLTCRLITDGCTGVPDMPGVTKFECEKRKGNELKKKVDIELSPYLKRLRVISSRYRGNSANGGHKTKYRKKVPRIQRICKQCGQIFLTTKKNIENGHGIYCSSECAWESMKKKRKKIICENCGKEFKVIPSVAAKGKRGRLFCDADCKREFIKKKGIKFGQTWEANLFNKER